MAGLPPGAAEAVEIYPGDSFWTLGLAERAGLAALSLALAAGLLLAARVLHRRCGRGWRGFALRLLASLALYWLFLWLSPQIYYTYFRAIIPGLPDQIVIGSPPGPGRLAGLLAFSPPRPSLAEHARAALGWALIALAFLRLSSSPCRPARRP